MTNIIKGKLEIMWTRKAFFQIVIILLRTDYIIVYLNVTILCIDDHGIGIFS